MMPSNDAKCHREIRRRIAMGKEAFLKRKELLRGGLKRSLKKRMIKTKERSLISTIRARQRNWMGHLLRGDSLQREIMEGRMEGKRGRGRPRQKLLDWMMSE